LHDGVADTFVHEAAYSGRHVAARWLLGDWKAREIAAGKPQKQTQSWFDQRFFDGAFDRKVKGGINREPRV
jgi:hypothetical protein